MPEEPDPEDDAGEGRVLSPEELDIEEDEHVEHIEGDRYVVSADGPPRTTGGSADHDDDRGTGSGGGGRGDQAAEHPGGDGGAVERSPAAGGRDADAPAGAGGSRGGGATTGGGGGDPEDAAAVLAGRLATADADHGFDATVKLDGRVDRQRVVSDDLVTTFETLATWYARRVDDSTPVEEVLGILLTESRAPVTVPTPVLARAISEAGLDEDDSIGELLAALRSSDGLRLER